MSDSDSDSDKLEKYPTSDKKSNGKQKTKTIKANLICNNIIDENIILPKDYQNLKKLITYEYSFNDPSININTFKIFYNNENENQEIKNEDDYQNLLEKFCEFDLEKRIIIIEVNESNNQNDEDNENGEEENEDFESKCEKIINEEIDILGINIKALILNDEKCMKMKGPRYKLNHSVHNHKCLGCKKLPIITGYLYKCTIEDNYYCNRCALTHNHPTFQIP